MIEHHGLVSGLDRNSASLEAELAKLPDTLWEPEDSTGASHNYSRSAFTS